MGDFTADELAMADEMGLDLEDLLDLDPEGADDLNAAVPDEEDA